jgi:2-polyprenyl-6-methoxyphenol hydroxylase-like FAD-dependent oxidoreductase
LTRTDNQTVRFDRAIVVGGSLTGLLAARVLGEHFSEVTIIERDLLKSDTMQRPGVPHSRHLHGLLPRGVQIIEAFFPGIRQELQSYGAVPLDLAGDIAWLTPQGWGTKFRSGLEALSVTRDLLDWTIRRRVGRLPNVKFVDSTDVVGLLRGDGGRILGVRTRERNFRDLGSVEDASGDLVVIAAGRQNAIANWFAEVGLEPPQITTIDAHIGYASRMYRRTNWQSPDWKAIILQAVPPELHRSGLMFPVEGDRWLVTLIGADRDYPPHDDRGFLQYARGLRNSDLYDAIREAEPVTPICAYRATENRQHHLDLLKDWPRGLVVMGDAACAFNPVYGQGMSTAAIEATRLHSFLCAQGARSDLGRTFQQEIARIIQSPWTLATSADLRFRSVEGARASRKTKIMHWYVDQVLRLGTTDQWARRRFLEVQGMLREASAILKPGMMARVLLDLGQPRFLRRPGRETSAPNEPAWANEMGPWAREPGQLVNPAGNYVPHPEHASELFASPRITGFAANVKSD